MRKTSVYLPDELKESLADLAARTGRSEAELIRTAIERLVNAGSPDAAAAARRAAVPVPVAPGLVGVGVGPGDPDLLTARATQVLQQADCVFAACTGPDAIGRAEAIVRAALPDVVVERLVMVIDDDPTARRRALEAAARQIAGHLDRGELVAFVTLGDPSLYSTFPALARLTTALCPGVAVDVVPGITPFQELAARTGTVIAEGEQEVAVVVLGRDASRVDLLLDDPERAVIVYKGARHARDMADRLAAHRRLDGAVLGELLGLPGGRSELLADVADRPASYLATVIVPPVRAVGG